MSRASEPRDVSIEVERPDPDELRVSLTNRSGELLVNARIVALGYRGEHLVAFAQRPIGVLFPKTVESELSLVRAHPGVLDELELRLYAQRLDVVEPKGALDDSGAGTGIEN